MKRLPWLLLLAGCTEPVLVLPDFTIVDEFFQDPADEVDILLVVDDSRSMLAEQEKLSAEFEAFVEFFYVAQTDFHIGVTTTDMTVAAGRLVGLPNVITRATPNAAQVFRDNVRVGAEGSGFEKGFDAAYAAVSPALTNGPNAAFYRPEASLAVIFVSDEDDGSAFPVDSYLNAFWELKGQRDRAQFRASALTGVDPVTLMPAECGRVADDIFEGADDAPRYWDLVQQSGGVVRSLCEDSFSEVVAEIGLASSGLTDRFPLTQEPRPGPEQTVVTDDVFELRLFIPGTPEFLGDGLVVPPEGVEGEFGWTYESADGNFWIRFVDLDSLPPIDSRITVTYERR